VNRSPRFAAKARYHFPPHMEITERVRLILRGCLVFQSCDSPNVSQEKPIRRNPVTEGFWVSVCLDSLPSHQCNGMVRILIAFCCVWTALLIGF